MSYMQETTVRLIQQPPADRSYNDIQFVVPWLRKKSQLLQGLDTGVLSEIIRGCGYQKCAKHDVIISQGDIGDCMYIILDGVCGVYIDAAKSGEDELVSTTASDLLSSSYRGSHISTGPSHSSRRSKQLDASEKNSEKTDNKTQTKAKKPSVRFEEDVPDSAEAMLEQTQQAEVAEMETTNTSIDELLQTAEQKGPKKKFDKSKFGRFIMTFNEGRCFGELALMSKDATRNASILAEEVSYLLIISRELYNHTLKTFQENEYRQRKHFVAKHPLFAKWQTRFLRLLEMSLVKEIYPTGAPIITQGEPVNGLIFILSGQAKIVTEPSRHQIQYQYMTPFIVDDVSDGLNWIRGSKKPKKVQDTEEARVRTRNVDIKRKQGYAALEKLHASKVIQLSVVGPGEILGEVEAVTSLKTYTQSVSALEQVDAFVLNAKNFERLVVQKNQKTIELLKMVAETKLRNRLQHVSETQVPLYKHLLYNLRRTERPKSQEKEVVLVPRKSLPDRETLFKHLTESYKNNQAELVEPIVPGSIFIRDVMRERARIREHIRSVRKQPAHQHRTKVTRQRKQVFPRSNQQLKKDLERQKEQKESQERVVLVRNIRKLEMTDVKEELAESKTKEKELPSNNILRSLVPEDRHRVSHILKNELKIELPRSSSDDIELPAITKPTVRLVRKRKLSKKKRTKENDFHVLEEEDQAHHVGEKEAIANKSADDLTLHLERTKTFITEMRRDSEPDLSRDPTRVSFEITDVKQPSTERNNREEAKTASKWKVATKIKPPPRPFSATPDALPTDYILPRAVAIPPTCKPEVSIIEKKEKHKMTSQEKKRRKTQAQLRFMNDLIRQKLRMAPENPTYRDWETGDISVAYLENRINQFNYKQGEYMETPTTVALPQLKRFQAKDEEPHQPRPGGRVFVKRQECPMLKTNYQMLNHRHTRFHMVPELPEYENLRRSRMLMQLVLDDVRTKTVLKK